MTNLLSLLSNLAPNGGNVSLFPRTKSYPLTKTVYFYYIMKLVDTYVAVASLTMRTFQGQCRKKETYNSKKRSLSNLKI